MAPQQWGNLDDLITNTCGNNRGKIQNQQIFMEGLDQRYNSEPALGAASILGVMTIASLFL